MEEFKYLKKYAETFNYKLLERNSKDRVIFLKKVDAGFIAIEKSIKSKYVNFYFNEDCKKFKESDLLLCAINGVPAGWEEELCQ